MRRPLEKIFANFLHVDQALRARSLGIVSAIPLKVVVGLASLTWGHKNLNHYQDHKRYNVLYADMSTAEKLVINFQIIQLLFFEVIMMILGLSRGIFKNNTIYNAKLADVLFLLLFLWCNIKHVFVYFYEFFL